MIYCLEVSDDADFGKHLHFRMFTSGSVKTRSFCNELMRGTPSIEYAKILFSFVFFDKSSMFFWCDHLDNVLSQCLNCFECRAVNLNYFFLLAASNWIFLQLNFNGYNRLQTLFELKVSVFFEINTHNIGDLKSTETLKHSIYPRGTFYTST